MCDTGLKSSQNQTGNNTHNADISKLIRCSHGVIIEQAGSRDPARICIISKDDKLVLIASVTHPEKTLLNIGHNHTLPNSMDASHQVRNMLQE